MGAGWRAVAAGSLLAIKHFNERNASIIREFGQLQGCDLHLEPVLLDTASNAARSVSHYLRKFSDITFDLIIGPARSVCSLPVALLAGIERVPQVSYWSSSTKLEDREKHPYFFRVIPSDSATAFAAATFFADLRYQHVGLVHMDDDWGRSWAAAFAKFAGDHGIDGTFHSFTESDTASIDTALLAMKATGFNVFMVVSLGADLEHMWTHATSLGITGPGYLWVFADGISTQDLTNSALKLAGSGRVFSSGKRPAWPQSEEAQLSWAEQDANLAFYNRYLTQMHPWFNLTEGFFEAHPPADLEFFAYDAVVTHALAVCEVQLAGLDLTGANIKSKLMLSRG